MRRFIDTPLATAKKLTLTDENYNYIARVLRKREGDIVTLFNGTGGEYSAEITAITRREVIVNIGKFTPENRESTLNIHLFQSLAKGEKMELVLQKSTELGIASITPVITERSVMHLKRNQLEKRLERWHNIILSACEQSGLNLPPILNSPIKLEEITPPKDVEDCKIPLLTLAPTADKTLGKTILEEFPNQKSFALIIGPEGGLSAEEIALLEAKNAISVTLGKRILRTETAALSVISSLHALIGDWA